VAQLENDDILHPQVLLYPLHALLPCDVLERVVVFSVQPIHDILLKVLEEVHLTLQIFGIDLNSVGLAHVHRTLTAGSDIVEVTEKYSSVERNVTKRR